MTPTEAGPNGPASQLVKKASQSSRPQTRIKGNPFFPAACTSEKTLLAPQTWELSAFGGRRVRCSGAHPLVGKPRRGFSTVSEAGPNGPASVALWEGDRLGWEKGLHHFPRAGAVVGVRPFLLQLGPVPVGEELGPDLVRIFPKERPDPLTGAGRSFLAWRLGVSRFPALPGKRPSLAGGLLANHAGKLSALAEQVLGAARLGHHTAV